MNSTLLVLIRSLHTARGAAGAASAAGRGGRGMGMGMGAGGRVGGAAADGWSPRGRLRDVDGEVWSLVSTEKMRQRHALELTPAENFCSRAVQECLGSCLTNKLSVRGKPGRRVPGGAVVEAMEILCQQRALEAFGLDGARWAVDVLMPSGSAARAAALTCLLKPDDRFMAPEAPSTREATRPRRSAGADVEMGRRSLGLGTTGGGLFNVVAYPMDRRSGLVDYDAMGRIAMNFRPKVIVARAACCPRVLDLARFRHVCDSINAILLVDYAQESGLVAARVLPAPFESADVVTAACNHTMRGPRCGLLFYRHKGRGAALLREKLAGVRRVAPHNNVIAAAAVALREAQHDYFFEYQQQVVRNAKALATALAKQGHHVLTAGTDTHLVLLDLSGRALTSHQAAMACDLCGIAVARGRRGLRLGSAALTSRGLQIGHFSDAAFLLDRALQMGARAASVCQPRLTMRKVLSTDAFLSEIKKINQEVIGFANRFPMPGFDTT